MFKPSDIAHESGLFGPTPELKRLADLTTIAALPGSGAGYQSALPAERNERPTNKLIPWSQVMEELHAKLGDTFTAPDGSRWTITGDLVWPPIDLGPIGGTGC